MKFFEKLTGKKEQEGAGYSEDMLLQIGYAKKQLEQGPAGKNAVNIPPEVYKIFLQNNFSIPKELREKIDAAMARVDQAKAYVQTTPPDERLNAYQIMVKKMFPPRLRGDESMRLVQKWEQAIKQNPHIEKALRAWFRDVDT